MGKKIPFEFYQKNRNAVVSVIFPLKGGYFTLSSLQSKTVSSLLWAGLGKYGAQLTGFAISIVLARLLEPSQFGLLGMLTIFLAISNTFINSGFGSALIQKQSPSNDDYSTVFFFNLVMSTLLYVILFFAASHIARFYEQPSLVAITKVLGISLIVNSFGLIHLIRLQKILEFKTLTKISIMSSVMSGAIAIIFAALGFGVWSLVVYSLGSTFVRTILLWVFDSWKPSLSFSKKSFAELFDFGSKLLMSGLIHTIFDNIYNVVIGKFYSPVSLAFYSRAKKMQSLASSNFIATIQTVTFPVFSKIQNNQLRLESGYKKLLNLVSFLIFPLMILLALIAKPLILVLLGEKWIQTIPYLQVLAIIGMMYPVSALNLNILNVKGRSDLFLKLEILKSILRVIAIFITAKISINAILMGQVVLSVFAYFLNTYYSKRFLSMGSFKQLRIMMPYALISIISACIAYLPSYLIINPFALLPIQVVVYILTYYLISRFMRIQALEEFVFIITPYLKRIKVRGV